MPFLCSQNGVIETFITFWHSLFCKNNGGYQIMILFHTIVQLFINAINVYVIPKIQVKTISRGSAKYDRFGP